jgi:hypothetical protein
MVLGFHKADLESEKDLAEFSELLELNEALGGVLQVPGKTLGKAATTRGSIVSSSSSSRRG